MIIKLLFGWKLVKVSKQSAGLELFDVEEYLFELKVTTESAVIGQTVKQLKQTLIDNKMDLLSIIHKGERFPNVYHYRGHELVNSDLLMVQGSHDDIDAFATTHKLEMVSAENARNEILHSEDSQIAEIVVTPQSSIVGRTPTEIRFNRRYGVNLLAASRSGSPHQDRLREFKFETGDVLLLHGGGDELYDAINKMDCYPLAKRDLEIKRSAKSVWALGIFLLAISAAASGLLSIQLALGFAAVGMALLNIVPVREFYDGVDWPVVILLGAMIPIGGALETTGTTGLLVDGLLSIAGGLSPALIIALILIITMTVSDVLNNAATAILMAPIAFNIALSLGLNPDAFLMAVAVGASCAFLTPIGHQNNALIMGPGGYKFSDYWPMGLPLEIVIVMVAVPLLLICWPI